jgi:ribose 1,5-bisphosphate isomerase
MVTMSVEEIAKKIETMEIRGAALIASSAAGALRDFAESYQGRDFKKDIAAAARRLYSTRPTAVTLWNAIHFVIGEVGQIDNKDTAMEHVIKKATEFVDSAAKAKDIITKLGAGRIKDGDTVLTHCNSSLAVETINRAHADGKDIKAYNTESRPWRQGLITARQLSAAGVDTTLIIDSAVRYVMPEMDCVVVGADAIASNGAVVNKIGTSQIALCAHEARVPFMVCAETNKFSPRTLYGELVEIEERDVLEVVDEQDIGTAKVFNPVFDFTRPEYVDVIVTELGILSPFAAYEVITHRFGQNTLFEKEWWI